MGITFHLPFDIQRWELHEIFALDSLTYFVAVVLIYFIRYTPVTIKTADTGTVWERITTGFRFLKANPLIFLFGNASFAIFVILIVQVHLLIPLYIDKHLIEDASVYASTEIYYSLGALLAGLAITKIFNKMHPVQAIILLMLITVAMLAVCTLTKSVFVFFIFAFVIGITNAGTRILRVTYLFHHTPNYLIGRTSSVFNVINVMLRWALISIFSTGFFSERNHVLWAYFICTVFVALWTIPLITRMKKLLVLSSKQ
jgi:MFS family permease